MVTCCQDLSSRYPQMTDEEVVVYARAGYASAVDYLMEKYRHLVETQARAFFLRGADADDVIQEGMIGLYKAIRDYRTDRLARFRAFADLCVRRQIITAVKSASRLKHGPLNGYVSIHGTYADGEPDTALIDVIADEQCEDPAESCARGQDVDEFFREVYQTLSSLEASVLQCYLRGLSYREMSKELRCGTKCIDNALQRIKRKIVSMRAAREFEAFC